ncbi:MAG: sulfatase [Proteobacteria bacterium]|nr:sulfatase [Pseudomonadota bacterium]
MLSVDKRQQGWWLKAGGGVLLPLALLALVAACQPDAGSVFEPRTRFVDPAHRAGRSLDSLRTADWTLAEIHDETRYVLGTAPRKLVKAQRGILVPEGGLLELLAGLPVELVDSERVVLVSQVYYDKSWHELARLVKRPLTFRGSDPFVKPSWQLPAGLAGSRVRINIEGYGLAAGRDTEYRAPAVVIAEGSVLEFGVGLLEPAWQQGSVLFELEACEGELCSSIFSRKIDPSIAGDRGWKDQQLDLADMVGKEISFNFTTELLAEDEEAFSLPVWSNPTVYTMVGRAADEPNIILLSIDTLRADHLGAYDYERDTSPFIDKTFGDRGTVFEHLVAAATTTTPSHMSIFTSLYPSSHGLTTGLEPLDPSLTTVSELLREAGFETGAVTEDGWLGIRHGFGRGFNEYAENKSANIMAPEGQVDVTFAKAKRWLRRNAGKKFFLFLHTFQVHDPYAPPEAYQHLFVDDGVVAPEWEGGPMAHMRSPTLYDREIRYTDDELKSFFATMEELKLLDNTVFILTSDHGEEFGEHGYLGHGAHMHDEVQRVPLMFYGPGVRRGYRVAEPVSHIDIMPTILEIAGVGGSGQARGLSLVKLLDGERTGDLRDRSLFSEGWTSQILYSDMKRGLFDKPALSVRIAGDKLHRYRNGDEFSYEYFDLNDDPGETNDLLVSGAAVSGTARAVELRRLVDGHLDEAAVVRSELLSGRVDVAPDENFLDPAREEKLRALGYIE